jgi:Uncharacterized protein conserved in bacteria
MSTTPTASGDDKTIAVLAHLSPIIALVLTAGWLSWLGPLIVWLIWRDKSPLVRTAAATSFNFNITIWIAIVIGWILAFTLVLLPVSLLLWFVPGILQIVFSIMGALRASRGEPFKYPLQIPILH